MSAAPDSALAKGPAPARWYAGFQLRPGFQPDSAQARAVEQLQGLHDALIRFKRRPRGLLARTLQGAQQQQPPRGLYLHGGVGRGKSALMDAFFAGLPYRRKRRVHFHPFMREIHSALGRRSNEADPLRAVAADIARVTRVLCFDEFHVSDIADAMILSRLLDALLARGVVLVVTSNYAPADLYPDGLQRERFLPAIALLEDRLDVLCVDGGVDHRLRVLERDQVFFCPCDEAADAAMAALYARAAGQAARSGQLAVLDRMITFRGHASGVIWFEFAELCGGPRSQLDYLRLAESHALVLLSGVPCMSPAMAAAARRFTWLIDILYDHRVPLALSCEVSLDRLYSTGTLSAEFVRTVSRLEEMQSAEWRNRSPVAPHNTNGSTP